MLSWRRSSDSADLSGLSSAELRAVGLLWKQAGRELAARFDGSSMTPTIAPASELLVRCTDEVARGDVIVYVFLDQVVVHRLMLIRPGWFVTRGDAHIIPDAPITDRSSIIGQVIGIRRGDTFEPLSAAPQTVLRMVAGAFVSVASLSGVLGVQRSLAILRAIRSLLRRAGW